MPIEQNLPQYIDQNSKVLATFWLWYISFLTGWSGQKCIVQCMLLCPRPINQFKQVQQSRQQALRSYCSDIFNIYTVQFALHFVGNETHFPYFLQIASLMTQQRKIRKTSFLRQHNGFREKFTQQSYLRPIFIQILSRFYPDFIFVGKETHFFVLLSNCFSSNDATARKTQSFLSRI